MFKLKGKKNSIKYIFVLVITLATLLVSILNYKIFFVEDKIDIKYVLFTVILNFLICTVIFIDEDMLTQNLKHLVSILILILTPVYVINFILMEYDLNFLVAQIISYGIVFMPLLLIFAISGRSYIAIIAVCLVGVFTYALNIELLDFRGTPVVPADIFAISTALGVADNYKFFMTYDIMISLQSGLLWCILSYKFRIRLKFKFMLPAILFSLIYALTFNNIGFKYLNNFELFLIKYDMYDIYSSNKRLGTVLTYWFNANDMKIKKPYDYSNKNAEEILNSIPEDGRDNFIKPNVISVMNEAFADLYDVYNMELSEEVLTYFNSINDNAVRGNMLVSVFGGGTSVTEFEFLTGITSGGLGSSTNIFLTNVNKEFNSLAWDFKAEGYETVAFHPFWGESWRRKQVYPLLGFDKTIFAEDMGAEKKNGLDIHSKPDLSNYECIRGYLSDRECYKEIERLLEEKDKDKPIFIHNVTIQNHGNYGDFEADDFANIKNGNLNYDFDYTENQTYFTLMKESDAALKDLMDYLKKYDEPTVLVFYGDHQPTVAPERDASEKYVYLGDDCGYVVPFFIWANFDIEEKNIDLTSPVYLSSIMKESCNIKMTNWDLFRSELSKSYPVLTLRTGYNADMQKLDMSNEESEIYNKYKILQYAIIFDSLMAK